MLKTHSWFYLNVTSNGAGLTRLLFILTMEIQCVHLTFWEFFLLHRTQEENRRDGWRGVAAKGRNMHRYRVKPLVPRFEGKQEMRRKTFISYRGERADTVHGRVKREAFRSKWQRRHSESRVVYKRKMGWGKSEF